MDKVLEDLKNEIQVDSLKAVEKDYDIKKRSEEIKKEKGIPTEKPIKEEAKELGETIKDKLEEIEDIIEKETDELFEDKDEKDSKEVEDIEETETEQRDYALSKKRSNIDNYYKAKELL